MRRQAASGDPGQLSAPSAPTIRGTRPGSPHRRKNQPSAELQLPLVLLKMASQGNRHGVAWGQLARLLPGSRFCRNPQQLVPGGQVTSTQGKKKRKTNHPRFSMAVPAAKITREYCTLFIRLMCELFWLRSREGRAELKKYAL